jgi:hypothetical protein
MGGGGGALESVVSRLEESGRIFLMGDDHPENEVEGDGVCDSSHEDATEAKLEVRLSSVRERGSQILLLIFSLT